MNLGELQRASRRASRVSFHQRAATQFAVMAGGQRSLSPQNFSLPGHSLCPTAVVDAVSGNYYCHILSVRARCVKPRFV